jgi:hypothetical protein
MNKSKIFSRRDFVKNTMITASGISLAAVNKAQTQKEFKPLDPNNISLKWLEQPNTGSLQGTTWGVPWPKGQIQKASSFEIQHNNQNIASQTWPLAYWPDGSIKWTAHAIGANTALTQAIQLKVAQKAPQNGVLKVTDYQDRITIDTGKLFCQVQKQGTKLISILQNAEKNTVAINGKLVLQIQDKAEVEIGESLKSDWLESKITHASVEQKGNVRAVIKIEGIHESSQNKQLLPFVLRLYFYEKAESIRIIHTIIYDGNENQDFIKGLGIRFEVPITDALYNRHIRFVGENNGVFGEAVQGLTGLRRDPGKTATEAQIAGKSVNNLPENIERLSKYIPAFGDYSLFQGSPDAFDIQKRTKAGHTWLQSGYGGRASGTAYIGSPKGGLVFGLRNFWQSYPAQLDIRNAHESQAEITLWFWAPKAPTMDLRFYHDGMGQDTFEKQREALDITYEDYEPEFGRPFGVARTSELQLWALNTTPSHEQLALIAQQIQTPPLLTVTPEYLASVGVFGNAFTLPDKSSEKKKAIEEQLDFYFDFYKKQVEQHHWYGFWNYGDVMHTYDHDRHVWRYDVGGFAWDNSELSTDLWLWYYYLRTGKSDVFRMAEAMTRHTGEVDVHHIGRFSPLGSRHNVQHWGCSAKQLRISTAANRRFYYYLTADERVGDLMREQIDADKTLRTVIPGRKIGQKAPENDPKGELASVSFGTDWGALASAWLTEWERTGQEKTKTKLLNSMKTIAEQPNGFFHGGAIMNLATGKFQPVDANQISVSHLSAVFGLAEICFELVALIDMPIFEKAWLNYCRIYNASSQEQKALLGQDLGKLNLQQGHSRLTAFAAQRTQNTQLAKRAWQEFYAGDGGIKKTSKQIKVIATPVVLNPIEEGVGISTNAVAQWGLSAIQCLAFAGASLE